MRFDSTPDHSQGMGRGLPKVPREFEVVAGCLQALKELGQSPEWGHPRGLAAFILQCPLAAQRHPAHFKQLTELLHRFLDALEGWVAQGNATPLQAVELLRATQWSDSFVSIASVFRHADRARAQVATEWVGRFERAVHSLARDTMVAVVKLLEQRDDEGLADDWRDLVRRLEPDDGIEIQVDGIALGSITEFLPLVYVVSKNPEDPRAEMIRNWVKDRQGQRDTVSRIRDHVAQR